jgi:hypothetical protein
MSWLPFKVLGPFWQCKIKEVVRDWQSYKSTRASQGMAVYHLLFQPVPAEHRLMMVRPDFEMTMTNDQ